jgi:hypothetical protein
MTFCEILFLSACLYFVYHGNALEGGMMGNNNGRTELTREELYAQVWAEPMTKLAKRYGLSDRGLAKTCDRMGIPVPGRGYWAKVHSGRVPPQAKLPKIKAGQNAVVVLNKRGHILEETKEIHEVAGYIEPVMDPENQLLVPEELMDPLPLVEKTAKSLRGAGGDDRGMVRPRAKRCLDIRVGKESIDRAARIMDTLIKALDTRDIELVHTENKEWGTQLVVDGEALGFRLEEKIGREKNIPTPAEQKKLDKDSWYRYRFPDYKYFPSGDLSLKLDTGYSSGLRSTWADGKQQRVEKCLNKFIATAYKAAAHQKAERIRHEREEQERAEQRRRDEILRRQIEQEQKRLDHFTEQAKAWQEAQQLRAYVQAVRSTGYYSVGAITGGRNISDWCAWALEQANRIDPTITSPPSVLDYKDQFYWY